MKLSREIYQRRHYSSPPDVFFNVVFVYLLKLFFLLLLLLRVRVSAFSSVGELTRGGSLSLSLFFPESVIELLAIIPRVLSSSKKSALVFLFSRKKKLSLCSSFSFKNARGQRTHSTRARAFAFLCASQCVYKKSYCESMRVFFVKKMKQKKTLLLRFFKHDTTHDRRHIRRRRKKKVVKLKEKAHTHTCHRLLHLLLR